MPPHLFLIKFGKISALYSLNNNVINQVLCGSNLSSIKFYNQYYYSFIVMHDIFSFSLKLFFGKGNYTEIMAFCGRFS